VSRNKYGLQRLEQLVAAVVERARTSARRGGSLSQMRIFGTT
jgi:hypothetical protein